MDKIPTPCAACKHLRKKCPKECVFAPYFPTNKQANYAAVHKIFGASHVATLLSEIHPSEREGAMMSLAFEAQARLIDPVNGCSGIIYRLQRQLKDLQDQIAIAKSELASYGITPTCVPPPPITYQNIHHSSMIPAPPNHGGCLTAQKLEDEAQRFPSTQTAQMQQTQETQMQHSENAMIVRDTKIISKI